MSLNKRLHDIFNQPLDCWSPETQRNVQIM